MPSNLPLPQLTPEQAKEGGYVRITNPYWLPYDEWQLVQAAGLLRGIDACIVASERSPNHVAIGRKMSQDKAALKGDGWDAMM